MMIQPLANASEAPLLELEHRIPDFLVLNENATASMIEELESDREKHNGSRAIDFEPTIKPKEMFSLGSFSPLSIDF